MAKVTSITIDEKEYGFKYGLRSIFLFEKIQGKTFALESTFDTFVFYFCCFLAADENFFGGEFNKFIDVCEENPTLVQEMALALDSQIHAEKMMDGREDKVDDDKKKV